jgi:hypothetical protein
MDAQLQFTECAAGSTSDTVVCVCMAGFYNLTSTCARCPPNTISAVSNRSTTILNCRCIAGYVCTYTKRLSVKVRLYNTTLASFDIKKRIFCISAMATAAGVSANSVTILNIDQLSGRRRLLGFSPPNNSIEIKLNVFDIHSLDHNSTKAHLGLHFDIDNLSWEHDHLLDVRLK